MRQTGYAGIDYSLGRSNVDPANGIHFGVIGQNAIMPEAMDDVEYDYGKPTCWKCDNEAIRSDDASIADADWNDGKDYACAACEHCFWSEDAFGDEPIGWIYEQYGYALTQCLDNDIFVLKSRYYTFAQYCSPCVPGAGNLESPCENGPKTYCLGHDWFDGGKAPYTVYSVEDDSIVMA